MGHDSAIATASRTFLGRLGCDEGGNALMVIAASLLPLTGMVGGALDIGRGYLVESRLQQACDAGVLAARKRLGAEATVTGTIPEGTAEIGNRFFNANFARSSYGSSEQSFQMTLEDDYAITGSASAVVPTTLMAAFGEGELRVSVRCAAQLNFSNTDVMLVLDTTGSMAERNPDDTVSRIEVLKEVLLRFHGQLEASALAGARVRYGFVPYSTNVNVGHLLRDEWVVNQWAYQSRELKFTGELAQNAYYTPPRQVSGQAVEQAIDTYRAVRDSDGTRGCPTRPADTVSTTVTQTGQSSETVLGPPAGTKTTTNFQRRRHGDSYRVSLDGRTCTILRTRYTDYVEAYEYITEPSMGDNTQWVYDRLLYDVADWRTRSNGCIEERQTYEIADYNNVDLNRALDLNLDLVPTDDPASRGLSVVENLTASRIGTTGSATMPAGSITKWRPMIPELIYARRLNYDGSGSFSVQARQTNDDYVAPTLIGLAACPPRARMMGTMTREDLEGYLATLVPSGATYHDIGMIWGGRLLSPTGLFAAENADLSPTTPTNRNLIFLTDGETAPLDLSYSAYGLEPLDQRRWRPSSAQTLAQVVESRFAVACREVRKRGITVWVVGFGVELSEPLRNCAGEGRYFEAADAAELNASFATISRRVSELRIVN